MTAFSAAIDAMFRDPNMAADATYRVGGAGPGLPCRAIRRGPDDVTEFGQARIWSETVRIDVRVSEVATPRPGDTVQIGAETVTVQGEPRRDSERLVWTLDTAPA